jgi:DNA-binding transcriptional LysR family regulator
MPIATVSRRVSDLEAALGTQLLLRSRLGLALTDAGAVYLEACRKILEDVAEAERMASGEFREPKGALTITAPIVFGRLHVLPVVTEFLKAHPGVDIRLEQTDRSVSLHEEHVDLAVRIGRLPDSGLIARKLGVVRQVVCGSPDYLAHAGTPAVPQDLQHHRCITFGNLMSPSKWHFGEGRRETQVRIRSRLVVNTAEAAIDAAGLGLGLTRVLSYQLAAAAKDGRLVTVLTEHEPKPWPVHLVFVRRGLLPQKLRAFMDFAAPRLTAVLTGKSAD